MQFKTYTLTFTLLLLTSACPGKSGEDTDGTTDPTTTTSSSTTDDMPTTDPTGTGGTTDDALTTEADPTGATSSEDTTSADTESEPGPISPELESACRAACQNEIMCEEEEADVEECVVGCGEEFSGLPAECEAQTLGFLNCIGAASCLDLEGQIEESGCAEEFDAFVECTEMGPVGCVMGLTEGEEECGVSTKCPDEPRREIVCDTETCTCFEDDVEVASCPADGVCMQGDAIFDKQASCCNFE